MARKGDINQNINAKDNTGKAFRSAQDNMRNLASSAAVLEGPLGKVAGRINALGSALGRMGGLLLGGSLAVAGAGVAFTLATKSAGDLEQQMAKLDAVLRATGRSNETSASSMNAFARSLGEATLTSADAVRGAQAALSTFKNIETKDFEKVLTLSQDISSVFGGELPSSAVKLARALDNPREGLSGLSRNILATSVAWREMVASMFESGRVAEAQGLIIDAISEKVAGAGTAEAGGLVGAADTLGERWTRMLENLGNTGPLKLVTRGLQGFAGILADVNRFLEEDSVAQEKYNQQLGQYSDVLEMLGESIQYIDPTNLREVSGMLRSLDLRGIDLKAAAPFLRLQKGITDAERALRLQEETLVRVISLTGESSAATFINRNKLLGLEQALKRVQAKYDALFAVKTKDGELDAILADKANKLIDKLTKKSQSQAEQALASMNALRERLLSAGAKGAAKIKELEAAYITFINKLNDDANAKAQKRADKAVSIEEAKLNRLRAVLEREQALGTPAPGETSTDPNTLEEQRYTRLLEQLSLRADAIRAAYGEESAQYAALMEQKTVIDQIHAEKSRQIAEDVAQQKRNLESSVVSNAVGLLQILGRKNKAAAVAAIAITKGVAIARTLASAQAASIAAYASTLAYGGNLVAAEAARNYTLGLGYVSAGIIAATGIAQVASGGGGGGSGGGGASATSPTTQTANVPSIRGPANSQQIIIVVGNERFDESQLDGLMASISERINNGSQIMIRRDSPQAQEIALAVGV